MPDSPSALSLNARYRQRVQSIRELPDQKPFTWLVCAPSSHVFEQVLPDLARQCGGTFKFVHGAGDIEGFDPCNTGFIEIADASLKSESYLPEGLRLNYNWCYAVERVRECNRFFPYIEIE